MPFGRFRNSSGTVAAKKIIAPALNTFTGGPSKLYETARETFQAANDLLMQRAIDGGAMRADLAPGNLLQALLGSSHLSSGPGWEKDAKRLVEILIAGSRPVK